MISKSFELILCKNPTNTLLHKFLHTFVIGSAGVNTTQYDTTEIVSQLLVFNGANTEQIF